jgi:hypothetical protein
MRESDWRIVWDPAGVSPLVLLDFGDLMDSEIRLPRQQLVATGKPDFALRAQVVSRGNRRGRLEYSRRLPHATAKASWKAAMDAMAALPWGVKGELSIQPRGGSERSYTAAVLSSRHGPRADDGVIESLHECVFRVIPIAS